MRVFLDACVDPRVSSIFEGRHAVMTAFDLGWQELKDKALLLRVRESFDVFVTIDKGFEFQHNLANLPVGIVIVEVRRNKLEHYRVLEKDLLAGVERSRPGTVVHVSYRR